MKNPIEQRKRMVQDRIEKSFTDGLNVSEEIEKASHGVYEDNAENRRKNRVGQEYGHAAQQKEPTGKTAGAAKTVDEHAAKASDKALERAAADKNAKPEVREAAQKELEKRNNDNNDKEPSKEEKPEENKPTEEKKPEPAEKKTDKKSQEAKISETLSKMTFNGNQVHWPADLDISEVQKKYDFDLDDVFFDEEKNQFTGYAVKVDFDSSGKPSSKPYDVEQELSDIQAKAAKELRVNKLKKNAAESKEAKAAKKQYIKTILNDGFDKEDSKFMSDNEEHFKDYMNSEGFKSWDEFEEWGANGADDDWEEFESICKNCLKKIPAGKFLKKSIINDIEIKSVEEAHEILKGIE